MLWKTALILAFFGLTAGMAATSGFQLGIDFANAPAYGSQMASDNSGDLYFLSYGMGEGGEQNALCSDQNTCVTKVAPDGKTVLWQYTTADRISNLKTDASGGAYVLYQDDSGIVWVEKLNPEGSGLAWKVPVEWGPTQWQPFFGPFYFTVDATGRAYVTYGQLDQTTVVRVAADGSGREYMVQTPGSSIPSGLAADANGSAILLIDAIDRTQLTRLSADGSSEVYSTLITGGPERLLSSSISADSAGNVILLWTDATLQRFDPQGNLVFQQTLPGLPADPAFWNVALDSAGNGYVVGPFLAHRVKNSVATCGGLSLLVYGPDGTLLQSTYVPGPMFYEPSVAIGNGSVVNIVSENGLTRLSPNASAPTDALACAANAASYQAGPIAPGEIVVLYGTGLGPQQGIQTQATLDTPFPTEVSNTEVTFDGVPAPLLWVQEGQVNAVVPWALTPGATTKICVNNNGTSTNCLNQTVAQVAPGVLTIDAFSVDNGYYAVALNQDGTLNSADNPAIEGTVVTVFATGLGPITPALADGSLVNLPPPANTIPASMCAPFGPLGYPVGPDHWYGCFTVEYAGPAPYELAGVTQIDFKVGYPGEERFTVLMPDGTRSAPFDVYLAHVN